jgi:hypothetical protein
VSDRFPEASVIFRLQGLSDEANGSARARDDHFQAVIQLIEFSCEQNLIYLPLCPVSFGLSPSEFQQRYNQIDSIFLRLREERPGDLLVAKNYCAFLSEREPLKALEILEGEITAKDADVYGLIARLRGELASAAPVGEVRRAEYVRMVDALESEIALRGEHPMAFSYSMVRLAEAQYALGRTAEAVAISQRCIDTYVECVGRPFDESVEPRAFHRAHTLLGMIALDGGDILEAITHMFGSVDFPARESRRSSDASLELAERLWTAGVDVRVILRYLDALSNVCVECLAPLIGQLRKRALRQLKGSTQPGSGGGSDGT